MNYIFDLYGTLADIRTDETKKEFWQGVAEFYRNHGADYTPAKLKASYKRLVKDEIEKRHAEIPEVEKRFIEPELRNVFRRLYEEKETEAKTSSDLIDETALCFRELSREYIRLYPHVKEVLEALRNEGHGLYLLSNAQAVFTMPELEQLGIADIFDGIIISSDVGVKKPSTGIFGILMERYHLRPKDCVMVGNDQHDDILSAHAAGLRSIYIESEISSPAVKPFPEDCRQVGSIKELISGQ